MEVWQIIVLLGLCVLVYAFLLPKQQKPMIREDMIKQLDDMMDHFMGEVEQDHQKIIEHVTMMRKDDEGQAAAMRTRIENLELQNSQLLERIGELKLQIVRQTQTIQSSDLDSRHYDKATLDKVESGQLMELRTRYSGLFEMYSQGKSIESIAKKLGMNKGEVQLILQLSNKEEELSVEG